MDYLHCGDRNATETCDRGLSGNTLEPIRGSALTDPIVGHSYTAGVPRDEELHQNRSRARRFAFMLTFIVVLPVMMGAAEWLTMRRLGESDLLQSRAQFQLFTFAGLIYLIFLNAWLTAKTADATGAPFWSNFLLALVPPLAPAAWARIAGRPVLRPYFFLLIDLAILGGAYALLRPWPVVVLGAAVLLVPFMVYQWFGCALGELAHLAGLHRFATVCWLCLGPTLIAGFFLYGALIETNEPLMNCTWSELASELTDYLNPDALMAYFPLKAAGAIYVLVSLAVWIKSIHDDLLLPMN